MWAISISIRIRTSKCEQINISSSIHGLALVRTADDNLNTLHAVLHAYACIFDIMAETADFNVYVGAETGLFKGFIN